MIFRGRCNKRTLQILLMSLGGLAFVLGMMSLSYTNGYMKCQTEQILETLNSIQVDIEEDQSALDRMIIVNDEMVKDINQMNEDLK